ncbi:MAG: HK97 family phage prohead protease [Acidimicrobiia bacterium]
MTSPGTLSGRAVLYGVPTTISTPYGPYDEIIEAGALRAALSDERITVVREHDPGRLLGRVSSGTLELRDTTFGLDVRVVLPGTELGRETLELVQRGDLAGMSFAFSGAEDEWHDPAQRGARPTRVITGVRRLFDVSVVTWPAYERTRVSVQRDGESASRDRAQLERYYRRVRALAAYTGLGTRHDARLGPRCRSLPPVARWTRRHRHMVRIGK